MSSNLCQTKIRKEMKTQNKVQLIGYLGKDPVITFTRNGDKIARIHVATDIFFRDAKRNKIKKTTWHEITAWEKNADMVENNFLKGSHILVEGEIVYRTYEDHTGHTRYVTEIKAGMIMNLDR